MSKPQNFKRSKLVDFITFRISLKDHYVRIQFSEYAPTTTEVNIDRLAFHDPANQYNEISVSIVIELRFIGLDVIMFDISKISLKIIKNIQSTLHIAYLISMYMILHISKRLTADLN